jgi:hypothetical protein
MAEADTLHKVLTALETGRDISRGKWFGWPCLKIQGKVFAVLWKDDMVFKLTGEALAQALELEGSRLFSPHKNRRPMKEWVQIPAAHTSNWGHFAQLASEYVAGAAQAKKYEIIHGLGEVRRLILESASQLSPTEWDQTFLGTWSVRELLAHLVGWDLTNLNAVKEIRAGQRPGFYAFYDRDWQSYNARLVAEHVKENLEELVTRAKRSHQELLDYLQAVPADEYIKRKSIVTLLQVEIKDEKTHHQQIEDFRTREKP